MEKIIEMKKRNFLLPATLALFYLATHLLGLLKLPVFADESIYIRWAQLITDDWKQYLFFPLNDGKTPLFIWTLVPFQQFFAYPLLTARLVSVVVGLVQVFVIGLIIKNLGGRSKTQWLGMLWTTILPFWYFAHRIALMDGMLTLWISLFVLGVIKITQQRKITLNWIFFSGVFLGLGLWTKLPTLFAVPIVFVWPLRQKEVRLKFYFHAVIPQIIAICIGMFLFATLRITPSFGQLFHRGNDFTYPIADVLLHGKWMTTLGNIPTYLTFFVAYLTPAILILSFAGLFSRQFRRTTVCLLLSAALFCFPIVLFGKVVYPRYLFPASIFFTSAAALAFQGWYDRYFSARTNQNIQSKFIVGLILALLLAQTVVSSLQFMTFAATDPNSLPLVAADREQYLEEWSSGHGILETVAFIQQQAQNHSIAVATEGRFGTLPDGLLLYFHHQDVHNIYIEGTGEYAPVKDIPDFFTQRAKSFQQSILVVNSHRMGITLPKQNLLAEYCRPDHAPCLQIWDITSLVKK